MSSTYKLPFLVNNIRSSYELKASIIHSRSVYLIELSASNVLKLMIRNSLPKASKTKILF